MNIMIPVQELPAVIFDMDGVIIDSEPLYFRVEQELFQSLGVDISREFHSNLVGLSMNRIWQMIKHRNNLSQSIEELTEIHHRLMIELIRNSPGLRPMPGLLPLLAQLHEYNIPCAIASSSSRELIGEVLSRLDISNYFRVIVGGDEIVESKPDPAIFLSAASQLAKKPDQCLVIEDSRNGMLAARSAGMRCVGLKNPNSGWQNLQEADLIITGLSQLDLNIIINLLKQQGGSYITE
ncbi:MAG: HAD family phosphatase [Candidatus Cloacimonetes bacterium]|nr:HAD family phosphatase [Candidatus Cloacimonadota bacterium]